MRPLLEGIKGRQRESHRCREPGFKIWYEVKCRRIFLTTLLISSLLFFACQEFLKHNFSATTRTNAPIIVNIILRNQTRLAPHPRSIGIIPDKKPPSEALNAEQPPVPTTVMNKIDETPPLLSSSPAANKAKLAKKPAPKPPSNRRPPAPKVLNKNASQKRKPQPPPSPKINPPFSPKKVNFTFNSPNICGSSASSSEIRILVMVLSAVKNSDPRKAIRETWGSSTNKDSKSPYRIAFVLGQSKNASLMKSVQTEAAKYHDIIGINVLESYYNISYSSIMILRWTTEHCPHAKFLLKTDDDSFVKLDVLDKVLSGKKESNVIYGYLMRSYKPNRNIGSKWYISKSVYPQKFLPDFVSGAAYVMTSDVVPKLYNATMQTPVYPFEDVYVTGMCAVMAKVNRRNITGFFNHRKTPTGCGFKDVIAGHEVLPKEMYGIWKELKSLSLLLCTPVVRALPHPVPAKAAAKGQIPSLVVIPKQGAS